MNVPARHASVRELLAIHGLLRFPANVDTRQVFDEGDEQVLHAVVGGRDRLVESISKFLPEVLITAQPPLLGLGNEQGPHPHVVRLRERAEAIGGRRAPVLRSTHLMVMTLMLVTFTDVGPNFGAVGGSGELRAIVGALLTYGLIVTGAALTWANWLLDIGPHL